MIHNFEFKFDFKVYTLSKGEREKMREDIDSELCRCSLTQQCEPEPGSWRILSSKLKQFSSDLRFIETNIVEELGVLGENVTVGAGLNSTRRRELDDAAKSLELQLMQGLKEKIKVSLFRVFKLTNLSNILNYNIFYFLTEPSL